jgi:hypothetical protein
MAENRQISRESLSPDQTHNSYEDPSDTPLRGQGEDTSGRCAGSNSAMPSSKECFSMRKITCLVGLLLAALPASARDMSPQDAPDFVPGRILVKFQPGVTTERAHTLIAAAGARTAGRSRKSASASLQLPERASEEAMARAFGQRAEVEFADVDRIVAPQEIVPNDPWYAAWEWHLKNIQCPAAWATTTGSPGVIIAILDSGVDGGASGSRAEHGSGLELLGQQQRYP